MTRPNAAAGPEELIKIYRTSTLIKQTDESIRGLLRRGRLQANYYSPRGQEIVAAAMAATLQPDDYVVTIYRGLHDHLAKGVPLKALMAEYFGKVDGSCKGKGGCMHITHPEAGVMVTTGIVGSGMPIANGLALASQERKDGRVTVTNFGDGATNIGSFHESMNLASLWKLPVVFLCQNNLFAEHTATELCTAGNIVDRAKGYAMPGILVDGNDPEAMYAAAREAVDRARDGEGPTLIEARTFRFEGHNYGDPSSYIPKEMMAEAKANDPVPKLRALLIERGIATEDEVAKIDADAATEIAEAVTFAQESPYPDVAENLSDVYAHVLENA
ncbi:thiamine pyrophosphate-dependent dehydrogenase E1 component subunit alpha [Sphingomonas crocodyli]|uniref:Thiamine pyrophosphate-dependent dehydrogenase E1 component subunit alpha n=1 Tax=Sphingomonas crocodyli TaxID=1979270 RepID=A0A437M8Z7_9SPHN|nr:thiamine pyrophosphate-dependent dehydrogenase E1 component subunit alpha [Sphingomonas crocodyli]RVT94005.1 thiamine pyrophosphate-dependent dehydrogenase E1 component subunit alpha [Sphingomonas crocodyli]